jgi:hypothetical protein
MARSMTTASRGERRGRRHLALVLIGAAMLGSWASADAGAVPLETRLSYAKGEIVPIPASVPHEEGDMIDRRIIPNLRWIAQRYPLYITDGYAGRLPNGEHAGCRDCHVEHSDHYNGLAVDIVPLSGSSRCDSTWRGITRLARWAEPRQNRPRPPFRWVGYNGDSGHGCSDHLHLSWMHAPARPFELAEWVEVFPVHFQGVSQQPRPQRRRPAPEPPPPPGGISTVQAGGVSPRGD